MIRIRFFGPKELIQKYFSAAQYSWSEGKNAVNIYTELDGLDDVAEDASKAESGKTNVSLTIASVAGKQRIFKLTGLAHEITGVKVAQKRGKQTVSLKLTRKEEKTWHKLLDNASTKETVADDTANRNTNIASCVNQTTQRFLQEIGGTFSDRELGFSRDNVRRSTGVIFVQTLVHCSFLAIS